MNPIDYYEVRCLGETCWSTNITSEHNAHLEADSAHRVTGKRYQVFAVHKDGSLTGPYPKEQVEKVDDLKAMNRYQWSITGALKEIMMLVNDTLEGISPEKEKEFIEWFTWRLDDGWEEPRIGSSLYVTEKFLHFVCEMALAEYRREQFKHRGNNE